MKKIARTISCSGPEKCIQRGKTEGLEGNKVIRSMNYHPKEKAIF